MKRIKKPVTVLLAAAILITLCSCNINTKSSSAYHGQWIDSNLFENIDKMASANLKDDYAAATNYEWASEQVEDFTYYIGPQGDSMRRVAQNKRAMIEDESFQNPNIEVVRTADELFSDWDYRDSLGVEPLMKYFAYIDEIRNIDDVSAYMIDNDKNPFAMSLVDLSYSYASSPDNMQVLFISRPYLSLEDINYYVVLSKDGQKKKEMIETELIYILGRCGYSEQEIKRTIDDCYNFESKIVYLDYTNNSSTALPNDYKSLNDVIEISGNYPLKQMLDHYHITDCDHIAGEFPYLGQLEKIYTQDNVAIMKSYFKVRLALESLCYLDSGCYDILKDSAIDRSDMCSERIDEDPDYYFFKQVQETSLTAAMDQAYLDYYFDQATYNQVVDLIHIIKEKYAVLLNENEHISDESKKLLCEKLYAIRENVMLPSNTADFSGVELMTKAEGGTYLDAMCVFSRLHYEHIGEVVQMEYDRYFWDIYDGKHSTTITNAFYEPNLNSIFIYIGILTAPYYSPDYSPEEKLGYYGFVLAHEISHAFDTNSINADKDGNTNYNFIPENEKSFMEITGSKILSYFRGIEPFEGSGTYIPSSTIAFEVIADTQGVKICLLIAKDYEDFDYDLFFRSYSSHFRFLTTRNQQIRYMKSKNNPHPLDYQRINYTLMQFDEFIETYDIKPGDGMYLPPEDRTIIW